MKKQPFPWRSFSRHHRGVPSDALSALPSDQGTAYSEFIQGQLDAELRRRESLDERGARLQQSTVTVVALFATALGLALDHDRSLTGVSFGLTVVAGLVLLVAFACGAFATRLVQFTVADENTLNRMLGDHWGDTEITGRYIGSFLNSGTIASMRPGNNSKAAWLSYGIWMQGIGVLLAGAAFLLAVAR